MCFYQFLSFFLQFKILGQRLVLVQLSKSDEKITSEPQHIYRATLSYISRKFSLNNPEIFQVFLAVHTSLSSSQLINIPSIRLLNFRQERLQTGVFTRQKRLGEKQGLQAVNMTLQNEKKSVKLTKNWRKTGAPSCKHDFAKLKRV